MENSDNRGSYITKEMHCDIQYTDITGDLIEFHFVVHINGLCLRVQSTANG